MNTPATKGFATVEVNTNPVELLLLAPLNVAWFTIVGSATDGSSSDALSIGLSVFLAVSGALVGNLRFSTRGSSVIKSDHR